MTGICASLGRCAYTVADEQLGDGTMAEGCPHWSSCFSGDDRRRDPLGDVETRVLLAVVDARFEGRRAPSYRELALALGCSVSTVVRAVHELRAVGLLRMDDGAGSLVATVDLVADSRRRR